MGFFRMIIDVAGTEMLYTWEFLFITLTHRERALYMMSLESMVWVLLIIGGTFLAFTSVLFSSEETAVTRRELHLRLVGLIGVVLAGVGWFLAFNGASDPLPPHRMGPLRIVNTLMVSAGAVFFLRLAVYVWRYWREGRGV